MTRVVGVLAVCAGLGACMSAQSARVLPAGKTQLSVGAARSTVTGEGSDTSVWTGEVMVRRGLGGRVDGGLVLQRTPGGDDPVSALGVEPKLQLTTDGSGPATVSVGLGLGLLWAEGPDGDGLDFELGAYLLTPAVYVGYALSPTTELVFAPRLNVLVPDEDNDETETEVGLSLGLRFTDPARTWALHPMLGFMTIDDEKLITLGLAVAAGN